MADTPIRAAVVGGGIGGLAAAAALAHHGIAVQVYERAEALGEVGAGVHITPNSLRCLYRLGMKPALDRVGAPIGPQSNFCRADGTQVAPMLTGESAGGIRNQGMHRADLLEVLASHLPPGTVQTGHRCTGFEQDGATARVHFANGATVEADVVVAADGIQSVLQHYVCPPSQPVHSGMLAYRGLIARERLPGWPADLFRIWMGEGKHFMTYPVRAGRLINYVAFVPATEETAESWSARGDRDQLAAAFAGWDPAVVNMLAQVEECFWWGLYDREPLPRWTEGRLTLLGDAAHPMLPHLGQGANQAIEDGAALGGLLAGRSAAEVPQALAAYEALRRPRATTVQEGARQNGRRYDSQYLSIAERDAEIRASKAFRSWLYDYDVEREVQAMRA